MALDINKILNRAVNNVLYEDYEDDPETKARVDASRKEYEDKAEEMFAKRRKELQDRDDDEEEKERNRSRREANEYNRAQSMYGANPRRDAQRDGPSIMDTAKSKATEAGWKAGQWIQDHPVSSAAGAGAAAALAAGAGAMKLAKWVKEKRKASGKK